MNINWNYKITTSSLIVYFCHKDENIQQISHVLRFGRKWFRDFSFNIMWNEIKIFWITSRMFVINRDDQKYWMLINKASITEVDDGTYHNNKFAEKEARNFKQYSSASCMYLKWKFEFNGCAILHFHFRLFSDNKCFRGENVFYESLAFASYGCVVCWFSPWCYVCYFLIFFTFRFINGRSAYFSKLSHAKRKSSNGWKFIHRANK